MAKTLHELATNLQESIIKQQEDAHNLSALNVNKYNNLKLKMDSTIHFPHVVVTIGISEATFNIKECIKTDGGLGPDERYVKKWLAYSSVLYDLNELYKSFGELIDAKMSEEDDNPNAYVHKEGEAEEVKIDTPRAHYKRKNNSGLITVKEDIENNNMSDGVDYEIEASALQEAKEHVKLNPNYSLESVENIKNELKAYLNSSMRRINRK